MIAFTNVYIDESFGELVLGKDVIPGHVALADEDRKAGTW